VLALTNMPAMTQFVGGSDERLRSWGRVYMMYKRIMKPGASIVNQPILPGILRRDSIDVLPMG
jgi:hypothetical protein